MKAVLHEDMIIIIHPETVAEKVVLSYMNEDLDISDRIVLSEEIAGGDEDDS